ncbi:wolframin [Anabrus simplex]|uniref:wolframin n=1 Tax=Anabrus simplex TaxID=316456 RepID=UPI0034DD12E0
MAGVVPVTVRTSGRKQWTLHDGPRGSLRRLRSQLAEDGCPESQVVLAKQLLEERCELDADKEENARLGVYWLIRASEQGNTEATEILKQCLETGQGITEHNYLDVKACLKMSQDEKLARRAAREMFSSLSAGQEFITTDQLQQRLRLAGSHGDYSGSRGRGTQQRSLEGDGDIAEGGAGMMVGEESSERSDSAMEESSAGTTSDWASRGEYLGEKLTEDHLVSAAAHYARGEMPLVHRVLTLSNRSQQDIESMNFLQRTLLHPLNTIRSLYSKLIEIVAKKGTPFVSSLFPAAMSQFQTLLLLFVYSVFGTESLLLFIPMALYYASISVMVVSTFQMLHRKSEFQDFRAWSCLFISYSGGNLNPEEAEYQYCRSNLRPYGHFFLSLLLNLMIYPLIAPQWTPQSELTILAFFLTFLTLYAFMDSKQIPDYLALLSFAVHVLAKYPYETDAVVTQGWRFLDMRIPTFASYVVGNGVEFCLNFRAVFYLLIPAIFLKIASRDHWRGTYKTLIPHCVTLAWWQVAVISSQGATWYGLIRSALALVGLVLIVPLAGLAMVLLPVAAVGKYLANSAMMLRIAVTAVLASIPIGVTWYLKHWRLQGNARTAAERYITRIQIVVAIVAGIFLLLPTIYELDDRTDEDTDRYTDAENGLTWEQYQNYCHQPAWELSSVAQVQLQCSHLVGTPVNWDGYVTGVKIRSIDNPLENIFTRLPSALKEVLICFYGEQYDFDCDTERMTEPQYRKCKLLKGLKRRNSKCHLEMWNRYEFEVRVKMKSGMWGTGAEVLLIADNSFRNFTLALQPGDRVWFAGILMNDGKGDNLLGGSKPQVDLEEIGCLGCHRSELEIYKKTTVKVNAVSLFSYVYTGVKFVLNFLFNPLVIFK